MFYFHPYLGEDSHFDEHIFQMGWFNHQLVLYVQQTELLFPSFAVRTWRAILRAESSKPNHRENDGTQNPWDGGPLIINPIYT